MLLADTVEKIGGRDGWLLLIHWLSGVSGGSFDAWRSAGDAGEPVLSVLVGQATNIRGRVKGQFNNLRLMQHLRNAKTGKRILLTGRFRAKPGQKLKKCMDLAELALSRACATSGKNLARRHA